MNSGLGQGAPSFPLAINQRGTNESANGSQQCIAISKWPAKTLPFRFPLVCLSGFTLKSETLRIIFGHTVLTLTWTRTRSSARLGMAKGSRIRMRIHGCKRVVHISEICQEFIGIIKVDCVAFW